MPAVDASLRELRCAAAHRRLTAWWAALLTSCACAVPAHAQDLEPRGYLGGPVGLHFLVASYGHSYGSVAFDPALPLTDARLRTQAAVLGYARTLDVWGQFAKVELVLAESQLSGHALVEGTAQAREVSGPADPRFRFTINLAGMPAMPAQEYARHQQDLFVGLGFVVTAPLGQYDASRLVNIGSNRWSIKSELGVAKVVGPWVFEVASGVTVYTDNRDFLDGRVLSQAPMYSVQAHVSRTLAGGGWAALGATWYTGGATTVDGITGDTRQSNTRIGAVYAVPIDTHQSLKFYASTHAFSRTGGRFDSIGAAWQYRWSAGP